MAAYGIEELGGGKYKVIRFPYRWQMKDWISKKPQKRRGAKYDSLDHHLKMKAAKLAGATIVTDTRKEK